MTYCLALRLDEGLVFLADTRTNAGVDNIGSYRKLHLVHAGPDRVFVLESAGNLATTQEVLDRLHVDLQSSDQESLATVGHLFEAALYVGRVSRQVVERHQQALFASGADGTATFILGGQIGDAPPDILLIYPEGNYIRASEERPFLQIGESKYGKFMLELATASHVPIESAVKIALSSMMTTAHANLSVGPPYDLGMYRTGSFALEEYRITTDSPLLAHVQAVWSKHLLNAIADLPSVSAADLLAAGAASSDLPSIPLI